MKISEAILTGARPPGIYRLNARVRAMVILDELSAAGWRTFYLDGHQIHDKATFLQVSATAMQLPSYFGYNWDAFEECIRDFAPAPGYVLLYDQVAQFAAKEPDEWITALDIFAGAVAFWARMGTPLYVFLRNAEKFAPNVKSW